MGVLQLDDLTIAFGAEIVLRGLHLDVAEGELVSLLGPSGAGKTSVLKAVAGLLAPAGGDIRIDGRSVRGLPPEKRSAVMVFQKPLLFPFMNVAQNVGFGLRMQAVGADEARERIRDILALTRLTGLEARRVHEISGGQQQRVALARALVLKPSILLLDEPLSSLDANLRQQMRELIQDIQAQTRITTLLVTHDQSEALMLSHRIGLLLDGRLRQVGSPHDLFHRPADRAVAEFFGGCNFLTGRLRAGRFDCELGSFSAPGVIANGHRLTATIRPEDILVGGDADHSIPGRVRKTSFEGAATRLWVDCGAAQLVVLTPRSDLAPGHPVRLHLPAEKIRIFPPE
ncbi:MAG: ABC transporter ATP-binding protein [Desulfobacterales bacterium]|jgi:ABC-type Fe3+/spermidine/putrescine transport system ATPase subunit|nr:ABC transporter ATP-binding protein [Desulfobacterales bacterium]